MDVINYLKNDHDVVLKLFEQLESTRGSSSKKREKLLDQLVEEVTLHTKVEEQILYPAMKEEDKNLALESYEAHHVVSCILDELKELPVTSEEWLPKLVTLKKIFIQHVNEEVKKLFPLVKKTFDPDQRKKMTEEMQVLKDEE